MAPVQPPAYLQGGSYSARADRLMLAAMLPAQRARGVMSSRCGVFPSGNMDGLKVVARPTPDKWVQVAGGVAAVWSEDPAGGTHIVHNDGTYDVRIPDAHATLPRKDLVIARIYDAVDDEGSRSDWDIEVVEGTPASNPQWPALPPACLLLAEVTVPAGAQSITSGRIADMRQFISTSGGVLPLTRPFDVGDPHPAMPVYRLDEKLLYLYDGARFSQVFDDHYQFPYGVLAAKTGNEEPDKIITTKSENTAAIASSMTTTFTVPPGVPSTRRIHVNLTCNLLLETGTRLLYRLWLDGQPWQNRPARKVNIPTDFHSYGWSHFGMFNVPAAGPHTVQLRLWVEDGTRAHMTSGEISIALL